jgi:hypothetical protein
MRRVVTVLMLAALLAVPPSGVGGATKERRPPVLRVSADGRALEIQRPTDAGVQRIDVLAKCGPPAIGEPRIRDFKERGSIVAVTFGKHCFADVSLSDLSVRCAGCD